MKGSTNASARPNIRLLNQEVTFSANTDTETNTAFPYRASVTDSRINHYMSATVIFSQIQASSGNFADFCQTYDGGVYIYAKTDAGTITIPAVSCDISVNYVAIENLPVEDSNLPISSGAVYNIVTEFDDVIDAKANDNTVVHKTGNENISGQKTLITSDGIGLRINDTRKTKGTTPSNDLYTVVYFNDKNGETIGNLAQTQFPDGALRMGISQRKDSSNYVNLNTQISSDNNHVLGMEGSRGGTYYWIDLMNYNSSGCTMGNMIRHDYNIENNRSATYYYTDFGSTHARLTILAHSSGNLQVLAEKVVNGTYTGSQLIWL